MKTLQIGILKKLAEAFPPESNPRRLYNRERLAFYNGYLMEKRDRERAAALPRSERKEILRKYIDQYPKLAEQKRKQTESVFRKMEPRKEIGEELDDVLFCYFAYGIEPDEFVSYDFFHRSDEERKGFVSDRELMFMVYQMNDRVDIKLYNDKAETYKTFRAYYKRDAIEINSRDDFPQFLDFVKKHPTFVKKKVNEAKGRSIELIATDPAEARDCFERVLSGGRCLLEERVIQDGSFAEFNKSSVNTLRLITFNTIDGVIVPFGFARFGRSGSFVDNGGAGGIFVGFDMKTGELITDGFDEFHHVYESHPDSKKRFKGFVLPDFDSAMDLAKRLSEKTPSVKYIGWDLAYSSQREWVVIEGNGMSQLIGSQIVFQRGMKAEVAKIMSNMILFN